MEFSRQRCRPTIHGPERGEIVRENLKNARKAACLTQQAMADKLGISLVYYQKIEAGDRTGDFSIWDDLEDITGIHQRLLRKEAPKGVSWEKTT